MQKVKLITVGVDGGGMDVYRLLDGTVVESGSSGGMMDDEEEDPVVSWSKSFENFELWWESFKLQQGDFWICFFPMSVHDDIKPFLLKEINTYSQGENIHHECCSRWLEVLSFANDFRH